MFQNLSSMVIIQSVNAAFSLPATLHPPLAVVAAPTLILHVFKGAGNKLLWANWLKRPAFQRLRSFWNNGTPNCFVKCIEQNWRFPSQFGGPISGFMITRLLAVSWPHIN